MLQGWFSGHPSIIIKLTLLALDSPHKNRSAVIQKYQLLSTTMMLEECRQLVLKLCEKAQPRSRRTRNGLKPNGNLFSISGRLRTIDSAPRFKLHLRPNTTSAAFVSEKIPPLPKGKAVVDVFADFLGYLHQCARMYIEETHANGADLWRSLETRTEFVLTHPNGWEGGQQGLMRKAAILAGLIPDTDDGRFRLSFVTEGEASLHFCIQSGLTTRAIQVCSARSFVIW